MILIYPIYMELLREIVKDIFAAPIYTIAEGCLVLMSHIYMYMYNSSVDITHSSNSTVSTICSFLDWEVDSYFSS